MVIGLLVAAVAFPASVALVEVCSTIDDMLVDESSMKQFNHFIPVDVLDKF
jgi:hypothetical protein